MDKIKIKPGTAQETLIIPLHARKMCTEKFPKLYQDPASVELCHRLDYDFSNLDKQADRTFYQFGALEGALRQMDMMWEMKDYIKNHPNASIVCLGCGLDQDPRRCGSSKNKIYNLDFPDVIAIREEMIGVDPRETNIAGDMTDFKWLDQIDASGGVIIYAAGVLYYIKNEDVKNMTLRFAERFKGGRFVFDTVGDFGFKMMMKMVLKNHGMENVEAFFHTGDPIKELKSWSPNLSVSTKGYMLGYYDMKAPGLKGVHRLMAKIADKRMKMNIVRVDL